MTEVQSTLPGWVQGLDQNKFRCITDKPAIHVQQNSPTTDLTAIIRLIVCLECPAGCFATIQRMLLYD